MTGGRAEELEVLKASYALVCSERDRLRSARGFFSRPLGPAPASAGISTALVTAFGSQLDEGFLWAAVGALVLLVLVGVAYDGKPAYRHLYARELAGVRVSGNRFAMWWCRAKHEAAAARRVTEDDWLEPAAWYRTMIKRERDIVGDPSIQNGYHLPWFRVKTLQEGVDLERTGLRAVQGLWLAVIVFLVLARLY